MGIVDLQVMRQSGKILAEVLSRACDEWIVPGTTPYDVSKKAEELICSYTGAVPAFLNYKGFPAAACISVNEEVVHGIPSRRELKDGDIISFDCGVVLDGHYTDAARTIAVGNVPERVRRLIRTTKESLDKGIEAVKAGAYVGDVSYAIQKHVERKGFKVSLDFTGHGIGLTLHDQPCIPNYGPPRQGPVLVEGSCIAIEPVVFDGSTDVWLGKDGWTIYSREGNLSAHFEDTIIVTKTGPEIITRL